MNLLNLEEEKFKTVKVKGLSFKIRCILPKDKNLIGFRRRNMQGGHTVDSMTLDEFNLIDNVATIDVCTEVFPKEIDSNISSINWDDEELITLLAGEIRAHTTDIQGRLKKNKPIDGSIEK